MKDGLRARSGWRTGRFTCVASIFTNEGCGARWRPLGRSGCVTTVATSKAGDRNSIDKLGQANSAVPKKMTRSGDILSKATARKGPAKGKNSAREGKGSQIQLRCNFSAIPIRTSLKARLIWLHEMQPTFSQQVAESVKLLAPRLLNAPEFS